MRLRMDLVEGSEVESAIYTGRIIRMAMVSDVPLPLQTPDPTAMIRALGAMGMPQKGDKYPAAGFDQYYCKRHIVRAVPGPIFLISIIYEFLGILTIRDSSSLSNVPSQLGAQDYEPFYVSWTPPGGAKPILKILTLNTVLPMRHLTISQTVPYRMGSALLDAYGSVNDAAWQGLPVGYWLFSDLDGGSNDDGITYTYSVTLSTKQWEDWSQMGFLEDDNGQAVPVDKDQVSALRKQAYQFGMDQTVNGVTKVGNFPTADFGSLFGA